MAFLDESGLTTLWGLIKANDVKMVTGTYTGNGKTGSSNKNTLTFDFDPVMVVVAANGPSHGMSEANGAIGFLFPTKGTMVVLKGSGSSSEPSGYKTDTWVGNQVSVSGGVVSFYFNGNWSTGSNSDTQLQLNSSGQTYNYVAIG